VERFFGIPELFKQNGHKTEKEVCLMQSNNGSQLLTVREVAQQLRVDDTTVRRWIKNGVLEAISLPHRGARQAYRVRRATLDTLLSSSTLQNA
jgi:excisionase family DNA binding protein